MPRSASLSGLREKVWIARCLTWAAHCITRHEKPKVLQIRGVNECESDIRHGVRGT